MTAGGFAFLKLSKIKSFRNLILFTKISKMLIQLAKLWYLRHLSSLRIPRMLWKLLKAHKGRCIKEFEENLGQEHRLKRYWSWVACFWEKAWKIHKREIRNHLQNWWQGKRNFEMHPFLNSKPYHVALNLLNNSSKNTA